MRVELEFKRELPAKEEEKSDSKKDNTLVFISVFLDDKNVSVSLLEEGLANVQTPYKQEDECSNFLLDLQQAEEKAKAKKCGIFK